jgi:hypothetical protein
MVKKYSLTAKERLKNGSVEIGYNETGDCIYFDCKAEVSNELLDWLKKAFVLVNQKDVHKSLIVFQKADKSADFTEILQDVSFEVFWEKYDYKVGKKSTVENKWNAMGDGERSKALAHIAKYNYFLAENPHIQRKYPQSFLAAKEWDN